MDKSYIVTVVTLICLAGANANGQTFDLDWWTLDGGGTMWSTGGEFELSGTIGQPDAGVLIGGDFELVGGFWPGVTPACLGDCNCDGVVDFDDINALVAALSAPQSACSFANVDINGDGAIDFDDINPFVEILSNSSGPCP